MSSSWSEYLDQSGGSLALLKIQSSHSNGLFSWLSASCTDFDHRSLEGILLIVVQYKHAALSHCHGNGVTSVYGHMHAVLLAARALAFARARQTQSTGNEDD
jgi:hypothetical protein